MLVLTRRVNECVVIGSTIQVRVLGTHKDKVRLGFSGPPEVAIHREEVYERIRANGKKAEPVHAR
jgi:carbon storage regulator